MAASGSGEDPRMKSGAYRCFLIRCRLEGEGPGQAGRPDDDGPGRLGWRFTVEEVGPDAARRSFASLNDVEAYLEAALAASARAARER